MYKHILGIHPDENNPGFTHFILKPLPGGTLTWAKGSYHSMTGKIEAEWKKEGNMLNYRITVPTNTTATVKLPGKGPETVKMNGLKLSDTLEASEILYQDGHTVFTVPSGSYELETEL